MMLVDTADTAWAVAWAEAAGGRLVTAAVAELTAELTVLCTPGTARRELVRQPCSEVDRALAWDQALAVAVVPELEAEALAEAEAEATSC
jgi:type IV secretory pathway TrbF-like protein